MKFKKEVVILVVVIVGLSLYLAMRTKDRTHFELPGIDSIDQKRVDRLVFQKGETAIELTRKDNSWFVGQQSYRADPVKVRNMVNAAADLKITALVSESGNYDRYDLSDDRKVNVRLFAGNTELRHFDIGKGAPTHQHSFVRLNDDPRVYHARGHIHETFDATVDELRDETVLEIEPAKIDTLSIEKDGQRLTLIKKEAADAGTDGEQKPAAPEKQANWQTPDGQAVAQSAVGSLLNDFKQLKCSDYMADDAKPTLRNPIWTITFKAADQSEHVSVFAMQSEDAIEHPAISSGSEYAFLLTKSRVEGIGKKLDQLISPTSE